MTFRIYPSIGIARLGNSDEFFIGPEVMGSRGRELDSGAEVTRFKDAQFRVRKQAARFHLFQQPDSGSLLSPATLPSGAVIEWTVRLGNKKDAIVRPANPPDPVLAGEKLRPKNDPNRADRLISAENTIRSDAGTTEKKTLQGTHVGNPVKVAELHVDAQGHLLILGGSLISESRPNTPLTGNFYNNPNWHDDVSDGLVSAVIRFADGHTQTAVPAWVTVAPPDFAPGADPVVTLFAEVLQIALDNHWDSPWTRLAATPSFTDEIYPILRRGRSLGWVHIDINQLPAIITNQKNWTKISQDYAQLGKKGASTLQLRTAARNAVLKVRTLLRDYAVPAWMTTYLNAWLADTFKDDWNGVPSVAENPTAQSLTRAALEGAVGQGFFPGIEGGRILTDPTIYTQPFDFRIDNSVLEPGDLTALMAQPWQADFLKCYQDWWPSQRPDLAPQLDGAFALWQRPVGESDHQGLVDLISKLGMITVKVDANGVQVSASEQGRAPNI